MKKILVLILTFFISSAVNADVTSQALNKVSETISNLIPGEGITEVSLDYNDGDEDQLNFLILGVRDIEATDNSNFFTQFSLMNQEINSSGRIIGNIGLGYVVTPCLRLSRTCFFSEMREVSKTGPDSQFGV